MVALAKPDIDVIFQQPQVTGEFTPGQLAHTRVLGKQRPLVFLAFAPKCAGTFFRAAVVLSIQGQLLRMVHALGGRDAQPYLPNFVAYYRGALTPRIGVTHAHMMALPANCRFLEAFDIRPVIMLRSIPDMLVSLSNMLDVDPTAHSNSINCVIPLDYSGWDQKRKADFLLDIMAPWYVNYYTTWRRYVSEAKDRVLVLDYRELKGDPYKTLIRTLEHCRVTYTPEQARVGLDQAWTARRELRFNKGDRGRGETFFDEKQLTWLEQQLRYYPTLADWVDRLMGRCEDKDAPASAVA